MTTVYFDKLSDPIRIKGMNRTVTNVIFNNNHIAQLIFDEIGEIFILNYKDILLHQNEFSLEPRNDIFKIMSNWNS
jgi:hypothetical protein